MNKKNSFQKIRQEGGSRCVALTRYLPKEWTLVKVIPKDYEPGKFVILKFEKVV